MGVFLQDGRCGVKHGSPFIKSIKIIFSKLKCDFRFFGGNLKIDNCDDSAMLALTIIKLV